MFKYFALILAVHFVGGNTDLNTDDNWHIDPIKFGPEEWTVYEENSEPYHRYKPDLFTMEQKRQGWVVLHCIGAIYMAVALTLVCRDFFVPSLEIIIEKYGLQPNVVGASLMAIGVSDFKILPNILYGFVSRNDQNFHSIVFPHILNILLVIGFSALLSKPNYYLSGWAVFRDIGFFALGILVLFHSLMNWTIFWIESSALLAIYIFYLSILVRNESSESFTRRMLRMNPVDKVPLESDNKTTDTELTKLNQSEHEEKEVDKTSLSEMNWFGRSTCLLLFPIKFVFRTLPNLKTPRGKQYLLWGYLGSIIWIAVFEGCMLWLIECIYETISTNLTVPKTIALWTLGFLGLIHLPGLVSAIIATRKGLGNMAVSAVIGCAIFDVCFNEPLSLLIRYVEYPPFVSARETICFIVIVLGTLCLIVITMMLFRWELTKCMGVVILLLGFAFYALILFKSFGIISC